MDVMRDEVKDQKFCRILAGQTGLSISDVQQRITNGNPETVEWVSWARYIHQLIDTGDLVLDHEMKLVLGGELEKRCQV